MVAQRKGCVRSGRRRGIHRRTFARHMKHVGLNVAADPLMTLAYIGVEGGMIVCAADDPGQHSSQNEQDSRHYAALRTDPCLRAVRLRRGDSVCKARL